ncbi:MAG: diguanylate cyclase domain-containing protein [Arenimonas sp.]
MRHKDSRLWAYNAILIAITLAAGAIFGRSDAAWPPIEVAIGLIALQLLVWQYGFPAPVMGVISMERMPQIAAICLFPYQQAALLMTIPALLWPFINRRYRQNSWVVGLQRSLHNACMIWLMGMMAGWLYQYLGGAVPIRQFDLVALRAILAVALVMQVINSAMIIGFYALDGRDYRRLLTPGYLLLDLAFVPFGVLLALIYANSGRDVLMLFLLLVVLIVLSLHALSESSRKIQLRLETLDAAIDRNPNDDDVRRLDKVMEGLYRRIHTLFQLHELFIALHDANRGDFDVRVQEVGGERLTSSRKPLESGLAGHVFARGEPILIDNWKDAPEELRQLANLRPDEKPGCVLMVPITLNGRVLGVISIQHTEAHFYSSADKNALEALAEDSAPLIADAQTFDDLDDWRLRLEESVAERTFALEESLEKNAVLLAELQAKSELLSRQSREDALTTLANRRCFDEQLLVEIQRAQRYGHPLSLVLLDLDNFKQINDSAGHSAGDEVLKVVALLMKSHARVTDLVARIGGEEFALLLPEQTEQGAESAANLLLDAIAAYDFSSIRTGLRATISAGVAQWSQNESSDHLLRHADQAMYRAKADGRNRVCVFSPPT